MQLKHFDFIKTRSRGILIREGIVDVKELFFMIVIRIIFILLFLAIAAYVLSLMPRGSRRRDMEHYKGMVFAHRGLHTREKPENSMAAFEAAVKRGVGIELDIHLTKDKKVIVFHDDNLRRMCGVDGRPEDITWLQLKKLPLGHSEAHIPLFKDVLMMVNGRVPLLIEIKIPDRDTELCRRVFHLLSGYHGPYMVQSFNSFALQWFKKNAPTVLRGQLSSDLHSLKKNYSTSVYLALRFLLCNAYSRPDFISYRFFNRNNISLLIVHYIFRCPVALWTIRNQNDYVLAKQHFDMFITEGFIPKETKVLKATGRKKWL